MSMEEVRVLVTGGAGFIGSHVVDELIEQGCKVAVLDALIPQVHPSGTWPSWMNPKVDRLVQGDVRDAALLLGLLDEWRPNCIIHLAAEVGVGQAEVEIERFVDCNVRGTAVLLESILQSNQSIPADDHLGGIRRLIVAGSMSAYGEGQWACPKHGEVRVTRAGADLLDGKWTPRCCYPDQDGNPCPEHLVPLPTVEWASLRPRGVYAATKRDQEELCLLVGGARSLSVAAARFFNVYGPRQSSTNPYTGVAVGFGMRARAGLRPRVYEDGGQLRDLVHVTDVAKAVWRLVGTWQLAGAIRLWQTPAYQGSFNIGTGTPSSVLGIAEMACRIVADGVVEPEVTGEFRTGDIRACVADPRRVMELGWRPQITAEDGLARLYLQIAAGPEPTHDQDAAHRQVQQAGLVQASLPEDATTEEDPEADEAAESRDRPAWN
jgi:dTDP-L-rhamnose 4-epimerase